MICNKCNHKLPNDSEFCQYCGNKVQETKTTETFVPDSTKFTDELSNPNITSDEALKAILKFQAENTVNAMKANAATQPDNENDEDFGLVPQKPIFTVGINKQECFLESLCTTNGEPIKWNRRGSMYVEGINGIVDIYDTFLPNGQTYKTIYINMYGAKNSTRAPAGFELMKPIQKTYPIDKSENINAKKPKKSSNKKLFLSLTIIPIVIALVVLLTIFFIIPGLKYNHANKLLENGDYELAYSKFLELDGFSDSENMLLECRYVQAVKYRDAGDITLQIRFLNL